jgi:flagellar basal-body rod modification protein FlgD
MSEFTLPPIAATTSATTTQRSEQKAVLNSDFEVFLKMLTAQALYQDPLEPISSSDYAAQLAQFSMVEQQVLTNDLIESLVSATDTTEQLNPPTWLGLEVEAETPVSYSGESLQIDASPPLSTTELVLMVYNQDGTLVFEGNQTVKDGPVTWYGQDNQSNGDGTIQAAPYGDYVLRVEARRNDTVVKTDQITGYAAVSETIVEGGRTLLVLENGVKVPTQDVTGMRNPTSDPSS